MYTNVGRKIKAVATVICCVGILVSIILGGILFDMAGSISYRRNGTLDALGCVAIVVGSLISWVGSFILYAYGDLVENVTIIAELVAKADAERESAAKRQRKKVHKVYMNKPRKLVSERTSNEGNTVQ